MQRRESTQDKPPKNPWLPLFGFVSLVVFASFSWVLAPLVRPFLSDSLGFSFPTDWPDVANNAVIAFVIFLLLFSFGMMVAILIAGNTSDPRDVRGSGKEVLQQVQGRQRGPRK